MSVWDQQLAGDQLNQAWDAAIVGSTLDEPQANYADLAMLRRFHALDTTPGPDADFVKRLRQQMVFGDRSQALAPHPGSLAPPLPGPKPSPTRREQSPQFRKWVALAAMLLLVLGGTLVLWIAQHKVDPEERSIPAAIFETAPATAAVASGEAPLLHVTIDPMSIGATGQATWTVALEYLVNIDTGETYRQNGPLSGDIGISVVVVTTGTFDAISSGPTLIYRKGLDTGEQIAPNTAISLAEGDAWMTSMDDLASASNTSDTASQILRYAMGKVGDSPYGPYFEFTPAFVGTFAQDQQGPGWREGAVTIDLQRVPLDKHEMQKIEIRAGESFLLVTSGTGAVRITKDGSNHGASTTASSLGDYPPGSYTVSRDLSGTVDLYLARWSSAANSDATLSPSAG